MLMPPSGFKVHCWSVFMWVCVRACVRACVCVVCVCVCVLSSVYSLFVFVERLSKLNLTVMCLMCKFCGV